MVPDEVDGFARVVVPRVPWPVYRDGAGPPVVIVHELMGLTQPVLAFARKVVDAGFTAYLPVLAGPVPSRSKWDGRAAAAGICVSREIYALRSGTTSRAVAPLRRLACYAAEQAGRRGAGVVGMCFSGGFALAAACDERVLAGVAAQPSLPFRLPPSCARDLGMGDDDVATLRARLARGETEIYLTRFTADWISPAARRDAVVRRLGGVTLDEVDSGSGNPYGFGRGDHSVLAVAPAKYPADSEAGRRLAQTFDDVIAFLSRRLG